MSCCRLQAGNAVTQVLLRSINLSGKLHMVPAVINDDYVIRFAVCSVNASDDDIAYAWTVVAETTSRLTSQSASFDLHRPEQQHVRPASNVYSLLCDWLRDGPAFHDPTQPDLTTDPPDDGFRPTQPTTYRRYFDLTQLPTAVAINNGFVSMRYGKLYYILNVIIIFHCSTAKTCVKFSRLQNNRTH